MAIHTLWAWGLLLLLLSSSSSSQQYAKFKKDLIRIWQMKKSSTLQLIIPTASITPIKLYESLKLLNLSPFRCILMQKGVMLSTGCTVRKSLAEQWIRSAGQKDKFFENSWTAVKWGKWMIMKSRNILVIWHGWSPENILLKDYDNYVNNNSMCMILLILFFSPFMKQCICSFYLN